MENGKWKITFKSSKFKIQNSKSKNQLLNLNSIQALVNTAFIIVCDLYQSYSTVMQRTIQKRKEFIISGIPNTLTVF